MIFRQGTTLCGKMKKIGQIGMSVVGRQIDCRIAGKFKETAEIAEWISIDISLRRGPYLCQNYAFSSLH